jgi:hypothetical protein
LPGINVPWTVSWTGEQHYELALSEDFPGLVDLVQAQHPGAGLPRFASLHITRHRQAMREQLCHVCGQSTTRRDRHIFPAQSGGFVIMPDESERYACNVPPVHLACAKRAQAQCPHLRKAFAQPIAYPNEDAPLLQRTDVVPGMEELAKELPANLKIVFSCYRLHSAKFTRRVQALRAAG